MRIAVLTSGGDAPGMNAAIRAVVRAAAAAGTGVLGVRWGYQGLLSDDLRPVASRDVGGIMHRGGTVLGSARAPQFREAEAQQRVAEQLRGRGVDGVVVIGGNGSQAGAHALAEQGVRVVGVASTIDNDLVGSDITIGADTALNVALEAVDRLKTTASSHRRAFLVEVMGRDCGYLALAAAVAGGAEALAIPEVPSTAEEILARVSAAYERGNDHAVVVVAEGAACGVQELLTYADEHRRDLAFDLRATTLGHVQRGGDPGAFDRVLSSRLGAAAFAELAAGRDGVLVGLRGGAVGTTPLHEVVGVLKPLDPHLLELADLLAR